MRTLTFYDSSNIQVITYYPETRRLIVSFHQGGGYVYDNVPKEMFGRLAVAESVGAEFRKSIMNVFRGKKLQNQQ